MSSAEQSLLSLRFPYLKFSENAQNCNTISCDFHIYIPTFVVQERIIVMELEIK